MENTLPKTDSPRMTYEEFLEALRNTPRKWTFEDFDNGMNQAIRCFDMCPVSSLKQLPCDQFMRAAVDLRLTKKLADAIVIAADNQPFCDQKIRRELLEACGLAQRSEPESGKAE